MASTLTVISPAPARAHSKYSSEMLMSTMWMHACYNN
jgi:hypothetical protein